MATDDLRDQIEELMMMQRVDQELGATLDFENVLMLTMDWALRRTGALAGMYVTLTSDGTGIVPLVTMGYPPGAVDYDEEHPWPVERGVIGRAVVTREPQYVNDVLADAAESKAARDGAALPSTRSVIAMPIEIRGTVLGVISLESDKPDTFNSGDLAFVRRLAARAAIALDHARLYREAEAQADEMAALYAASRIISSSLERPEALANIAQSITTVLNVSSVIITDYRRDRQYLTVSMAYRFPMARNAAEVLPRAGDSYDLEELPELRRAIETRTTTAASLKDDGHSPALRGLMENCHYRSLLLIPLTVPITSPAQSGTSETEVLGVALAIESRRDRRFTSGEIELADALSSQTASALRQAQLYEDVRELETLKSEMIRMASHDLRNPLGNVMGYFDLLTRSLKSHLAPEHHDYIDHVKRSLATMKSLIEDLLTLERVESERQAAWTEMDFIELVRGVVDGQRGAALLKGQALTLSGDELPLTVFGSQTQLRQAVVNLVSNAIKYTPDNGQVQVRLKSKDKRLIFEVQDNGYGISKERQANLFKRFYRAHQPGTDHIPGTGLGLSLVKTVVERHGGEVWVHSEPEIGSTFGFWLPVSALTLMSDNDASRGQ